MYKKRILIITSLFPTPGGSIYSGSFVLDFLRELSKYNNVTILVPQAKRVADLLKKRTERKLVEGFDVWFVGYSTIFETFLTILRLDFIPLGKFFSKLLLGKSLRKLAIEIHKKTPFSTVHGIELFAGDEAVNVGKVLNIPSIITIHSLFSYIKKLYGGLTLKLILNNLSRANSLTTVSSIACASYPSELAKRMQIIPNGYEAKSIEKIKVNLPPFLKNKIILLYVGFLTETKRVDFVVRAVKDLLAEKLDCGLIVVGEGPLSGRITRQITDWKLKNNVFLAGPVRPADIAQYYWQSNIVLQPSTNESFSMACLEGMSYGKPFVCTSNAGISEYTESGIQGLVVAPENYDEFFSAVKTLVINSNLREKMGKNALQTAKKFEWGKIIQRYLGIYYSE